MFTNPTPFSLASIADLVGGRLIGEGDLKILGSATISNVRSDEITFATDERNWRRAVESDATAVVVSGFHPLSAEKPHILVEDAEQAFAAITQLFRPAVVRRARGVSPLAYVSPLAKLGAEVTVYPGAHIGDHVRIGDRATIMPNVVIMEHCRIGDDVTLFPNVTLYENTIVGDRCLLHAGVVLGAYGFGYKTQGGRHHLSAQLGNVEIGDDVEIGANTTVDRGTFDATRVGTGTKIDDQVMIGHNCQIGEHNLLCSQVGIAGSCRTGNYVVMAGQVGIGDHIEIGDQVILGAKAGVMHSIDSQQHYLGIPATPIREQMQILASIQKLPEMRKQMARIQRQLAAGVEAAGSSATPQPNSDTGSTPAAAETSGHERRHAA